MQTYVGIVKDNTNVYKDGSFWAIIPALDKNKAKLITYTSPYYRVNSGGMIAIPEKETQILVLHNENPQENESEFYFQSCIVKKKVTDGAKLNPNFKPIAENDPKATTYGTDAKPTTQSFTNMAGAGLYIQRDFSREKIQNNVIVKAESGEEVNVGPLGVQIRNNEGDSIVLNGTDPNDGYAARSLSVTTKTSQQYVSLNSDINMRVNDGGDINIENNSTGVMSISPQHGNVRLKSRYKDITLTAGHLGNPKTGNIHIVTPQGKIRIDGQTGVIELFSLNNIKLNAPNIDINAANTLSLNAGVAVNIGADVSATFNGGNLTQVNSQNILQLNGSTQFVNGQLLTTINPTGGDICGVAPAGARPVPLSADHYLGLSSAITPPLPNDYGDGFPGPGAI